MEEMIKIAYKITIAVKGKAGDISAKLFYYSLKNLDLTKLAIGFVIDRVSKATL